jgi:Protein of unknown function (DUF1592)/Protein of unknown function (DUF1588)/Protein of unknown function (DUF1585)/Protein of unknown function (DUF1595)/Protein of unknown function (DUF1587)
MKYLSARVLLVQAAFVAACNGQIGEPQPLEGVTPPQSTTGPMTNPVTGAGGPTDKAACATAPVPIPAARVWRLTHTQYKNSLLGAFGFAGTKVDSFPADGRLEGYANAADALAASTLLTDYYYKASLEVASDVAQRGTTFVGCALNELSSGPCLSTFLEKVGQKSWRRPLSADEITKLTKLYNDVAGPNGPELGLKSVVQALIMSPNFIFRTELGTATTPGQTTDLTDFELAASLSYTLWDGPPDDALYQLAASQKLHEPETLIAEAKRLLTTTDKASAALDSFVTQWLGTDTLPTAQKNATVFPGFDATVAQDMLTETNQLVNDVVFDKGGDRTLKTLLTASYGYVSAKTSDIYGVDSTATTPTRTDLPKNERRGILTQASFLTANAAADGTNLVGRGRFVRETFLCAAVDPPPAAFVFDPSKITDDMTGREKFDIHAKNPACAGCHNLFDGIGFAMEQYDGIGKYRTTDKGKMIDPSGTLPMLDGSTIKFANFVELVDKLSATPDVYDCFSSQYFMYALGRKPEQVDGCEVAGIATQFAGSGYKLDALMLAIIGSPSFRTRRL